MSSSVSLEYANARIKSLEKNLLTADKIVRLIDSTDLDDALKILAENDYGDGLLTANTDADELLLREENKAIKVFAELMPTEYGLETFVMKNDFHNAKVYYKAKISLHPNKRALKPEGMYNVEEAIEKANYHNLPLELQKALIALDKANEKKPLTGQEIDLCIDQAYFKEVNNIIKRAKKSVVQEYYKTLIEYTNIKTFVRCKKIGVSFALFEKCFIDGGGLSLDKLKSIYPLVLDEAKEKMRFTDWKEAFEIVTDSLVAFETYIDNVLIRLTKKQKSEMFTPSPLLGYYLGKLSEIKVVRTILTCMKNGASKEEIRVRVRETYA